MDHTYTYMLGYEMGASECYESAFEAWEEVDDPAIDRLMVDEFNQGFRDGEQSLGNTLELPDFDD